MKKQAPAFHLTLVKGQIGKKIVVKHYKHAVVVTKYPDMSRIKPSVQQQKCRVLFAQAVSFARSVFANPAEKNAWTVSSGNNKLSFTWLIKTWLATQKNDTPEII